MRSTIQFGNVEAVDVRILRLRGICCHCPRALYLTESLTATLRIPDHNSCIPSSMARYQLASNSNLAQMTKI